MCARGERRGPLGLAPNPPASSFLLPPRTHVVGIYARTARALNDKFMSATTEPRTVRVACHATWGNCSQPHESRFRAGSRLTIRRSPHAGLCLGPPRLHRCVVATHAAHPELGAIDAGFQWNSFFVTRLVPKPRKPPTSMFSCTRVCDTLPSSCASTDALASGCGCALQHATKFSAPLPFALCIWRRAAGTTQMRVLVGGSGGKCVRRMGLRL